MQKQPYQKVSSYEGRKGQVKRVVLLYSGGLDTSVMLKWIQDEYKADVIALTVDIGQLADDLEEIRKKALKLGAIKALVVDAKNEFAYNYLSWGIKANAKYQGNYHLSTPLGRPLLGKVAVEVARAERADTIAHGCTGKGNDQVRIEGTILTLAPEMKIIAPVREWNMGRDEEMAYAMKHGIPIKKTTPVPYSHDDNMWGVTSEGGEIENPAMVPPLERILQVCRPPEKARNKPEYLTIEFVKGLPVAVDGTRMRLPDLITHLNQRGARHAIGITHHIEDRVVGLKVRGVYEAPAAEILINAHYNLEKYVSTWQENEFKSHVDQRFADLCYRALWYEPLMADLQEFIDSINRKVTGTVTVKLYKGVAEAVAVQTPNGIFNEKLATFMKDASFNVNASPGFIELYTLQMRMAQEAQRFVLATLGEVEDKEAFLPAMEALATYGFVFYATEGTHTFLKQHDIDSILLHKIHERKRPNIEDLLRENRFDLILHTARKKRSTGGVRDSSVIREWAVKTDTPLITDPETANNLVDKLGKRLVIQRHGLRQNS